MQKKPENVWDFPRPAICEPYQGHAKVVHEGQVIAESNNLFRALETSHPPTFYFPPQDINFGFLSTTEHRSFCEWKGSAIYYNVTVTGTTRRHSAWSYPHPTPAFEPITNFVAFYPSQFDECYLDGERVQAQKGDFYGGWITRNLIGPFKGGPGTTGW